MRRSGARILLFILLIAILYFLPSCASYKIMPPSLDSGSRQFLDIVRYIITPQEERTYRELPPEDRAGFEAQFWKRRDPDPETEANAFRDRYFRRMIIADQVFRRGIPGWMTDRGRVYVLLGRPTDVIAKSMGEHTTELSKRGRDLSTDLLEEGARTERSTEIWVYNQYPDYFSGPLRLVFVDYDSTGDYKLTTDVEVKPFSMMTYQQSDPDMVKYQWIGQVEAGDARSNILPFLDYRKSLGQIEKTDEGHTVSCLFEIPFGAIDYREENGSYAYDLELSVEVLHVDLKSRYGNKKEVRDALLAEKLEERIKAGSALAEAVMVPLEKGTNRVYFSVLDRVSQSRLRKLEIIRIK